MTNCLETSEIGAKLLEQQYIRLIKLVAQLLEFDDNPSYYELIENFGKKTNNFALLNTSLNFHGYPLANTINDAFNIVSKSNLDGLILDGYLIAKRQIKF